jgi:hypothetical protein
MTDNTTDTFLSAMQTVLDMAPEAPTLPTASHPEPARRPVAAVISAFAAVLIVVGLGTMVLGQGSNEAQEVGAGDQHPATDVEVADGLAPLSDLPIIGTSLPGWEIGMADEEESADGGGLRTILYFTVVNKDTVDMDTVFAKLWIRGITEGSTYEADRLLLDQVGAEELTVRGHDARMVFDGDDYDIVWRDSPTAIVHLAVNTEAAAGSGRVITLEFADSLVDLQPELWADYLQSAGSSDSTLETPTTTLAD